MDSYVVLPESEVPRIQEILKTINVIASMGRLVQDNQLIKCERGKARVTLGVSKPSEWAGDPVKGDKHIVAATTDFWRFLTRKDDHKLMIDILTALKPHAWKYK